MRYEHSAGLVEVVQVDKTYKLYYIPLSSGVKHVKEYTPIFSLLSNTLVANNFYQSMRL